MILAFYSESSGVGKDAAADVAADYLRANGVNVARDAFAWDGKVVCADALGITGTRAEKVAAIDQLKLTGSVSWLDGGGSGVIDRDTPRGAVGGRGFIIGLLGSPDKDNGVRGLDEGFWTRQVLRRADALTRNERGGQTISDFWGNWTVVSDMRFLEEGEAVTKVGGAIVEIVRPENLGKHNEQRFPSGWIAARIINDGTLEQLTDRVTDVVRDIRDFRDPQRDANPGGIAGGVVDGSYDTPCG